MVPQTTWTSTKRVKLLPFLHLHFVSQQRHQLDVGDASCFRLGDQLEPIKKRVQLIVRQRDAHLSEFRFQRVSPGVLTHNDAAIVLVSEHGQWFFGSDDFVRRFVLQHAVLVNPGFVRKRVRADYSFVRLDEHTRVFRNHSRGLVNIHQVNTHVRSI